MRFTQEVPDSELVADVSDTLNILDFLMGRPLTNTQSTGHQAPYWDLLNKYETTT